MKGRFYMENVTRVVQAKMQVHHAAYMTAMSVDGALFTEHTCTVLTDRVLKCSFFRALSIHGHMMAFVRMVFACAPTCHPTGRQGRRRCAEGTEE
jgi:hypothetical protein